MKLRTQYLQAQGVLPTPAVTLNGFTNLRIQNNATHPDHQLDITADEIIVRDSQGFIKRLTGVSETLDMDVSGVNGLDTGSPSNAWHYVWVITKEDDTEQGALFSLQSALEDVTLPSGYTYGALVSAVYVGAGAAYDLMLYRQFNKIIKYLAYQPVLDAGAATTWTAVSCATYVPPITPLAHLLAAAAVAATGVVELSVDSGSHVFTTLKGNVGQYTEFEPILGANNQCWYRNTVDGAVRTYISVSGFELP